MENKYHIRVKNLSVNYGPTQALQDVNLEIPDGKITAIIGPSGCGKTTLLRTFNRLVETVDGIRVTGEVLVDDENIYERNADVTRIRKKMGLLSQRPYPLPMSIYDNVAYGPRIHGVRKRRELDVIVERYLRLSSLWEEVKERLNEPAGGLSIGQQQRLCLARGLAVEPEVILADEPTSALDPIASKRIEDRFRDLKNRYTIVMVTHILRQAKRLADHIIFIYMGRLIEEGPAETFFEDPKDPMTSAYISGVIS